MKRDVLGATELNHSEIRGQHAFTKAAFKRHEAHGDSHWIQAADRLFDLLERHRARTFAVWTDDPNFVSLRSAQTTTLSKPYKKLLYDFRAYMRSEAASRRGSINFDQRGLREDEAVGCAVQNFLVRTNQSAGWGRWFLQVPNFTVSAVSPGLQAADVVAHLVAHLKDPTERPELNPYIERVAKLAFHAGPPGRKQRCIRHVRPQAE